MGRSAGELPPARPAYARRSWNRWRIVLSAGMFAVPWGLFILAVIPDPTTGHRDTSFVVISLINAIVLTPLAICALWPDKHDTHYFPAGGDDGPDP